MHPVPITTNPFALMIDPQAIVERIERSERLERLQRRVCRPLDKPLLPTEAGAAPDGGETEASGGGARADEDLGAGV